MSYDQTKNIHGGVAVDAADQGNAILVNGNNVYGQPKADSRFNLVTRGGVASVWNNKTRSMVLRVTATGTPANLRFKLTFAGYTQTGAIAFDPSGSAFATNVQNAIIAVSGLGDVIVTSIYASATVQVISISSATVDLNIPLFSVTADTGTCKGGQAIGTVGKSIMKYFGLGVTTTDSITLYDGDITAATLPTAFVAHSLAAGASVSVTVPLPASSVGWFYLQNCDVAMAGVGPIAGFEYA